MRGRTKKQPKGGLQTRLSLLNQPFSARVAMTDTALILPVTAGMRY
jgi:hypothetical protein